MVGQASVMGLSLAGGSLSPRSPSWLSAATTALRQDSEICQFTSY